MLRLILAGSAVLLFAGCSAGAEEPTEPPFALTGRVVDAANIISAPVEAQLNDRLETLETQTGVQLVVATTPSLKGQDISLYSLELARSWGIGSSERQDGLMLLVAPNERRARIEVGYGLEASVRDEDAAQILQERVLPQFREGDYDAGILAGVEGLIREVTPVQMKEAA